MNKTQTQFIRTTREIIDEVRHGRYTTLSQGVPGFLLNEENIGSLFDITENQKSKCLKMMAEGAEDNRVLALVQGYPCLLKESDFVRCDAPKSYPVSGEII